VDAGSGDYVDLVASDGAFEGGVILPVSHVGEALFGADCCRWRNLAPTMRLSRQSQRTEEAIRSGLFWARSAADAESLQRSQPSWIESRVL